VSAYGERDAQRVVLLRSDDQGDTWVPDTGGMGQTPATFQQALDIGDTVAYVGSAPRGADGTDEVWTVKRIELTDGLPTSVMWAVNVAWNDRTTEEYS